jgi:hypothetical protein
MVVVVRRYRLRVAGHEFRVFVIRPPQEMLSAAARHRESILRRRPHRQKLASPIGSFQAWTLAVTAADGVYVRDEPLSEERSEPDERLLPS